MTNYRAGHGDPSLARSLYHTEVLRVAASLSLRNEGLYVCFANIMDRMPSYNQEILWDLLWEMARQGELQP